jgi:hypothetical protein
MLDLVTNQQLYEYPEGTYLAYKFFSQWDNKQIIIYGKLFRKKDLSGNFVNIFKSLEDGNYWVIHTEQKYKVLTNEEAFIIKLEY